MARIMPPARYSRAATPPRLCEQGPAAFQGVNGGQELTRMVTANFREGYDCKAPGGREIGVAVQHDACKRNTFRFDPELTNVPYNTMRDWGHAHGDEL